MTELEAWIAWGFVVLLWVCGAAVAFSIAGAWRKRFEVLSVQLQKAAQTNLDLMAERADLRRQVQAALKRRPKIHDPQGREVVPRGFNFCPNTGVCEGVQL